MLTVPIQLRTAISWRRSDAHLLPRRVLALRALVHPSLTGGDLFRIWGDYRNILGVLERYEDGMADWHDFGPDWETAGDNIRGEAEYAVLDLIHGINGHGGSAA